MRDIWFSCKVSASFLWQEGVDEVVYGAVVCCYSWLCQFGTIVIITMGVVYANYSQSPSLICWVLTSSGRLLLALGFVQTTDWTTVLPNEKESKSNRSHIEKDWFKYEPDSFESVSTSEVCQPEAASRLCPVLFISPFSSQMFNWLVFSCNSR